MKYCTVTDDGYVHYKDLHHVLWPEQPRAKQSSMKNTIYPLEKEEICSKQERHGFFLAKTDDIRKVRSCAAAQSRSIHEAGLSHY